jgi:protein-disulfide isomerase
MSFSLRIALLGLLLGNSSACLNRARVCPPPPKPVIDCDSPEVKACANRPSTLKVVAAEAAKAAPAPEQRARQRPKPRPEVRADIPAERGSNGRGTWPAKVVIVEYSDFECSFCARSAPTIDQIMKKYGKDVYFIYKHNPLGFHPNAEPAARAASAAGLQGKFFAMHDKLFAHHRDLSLHNFSKWAGEIGLDVARFERDLASPEVAATVLRHQTEARKVGARGTPNFFINGAPLRGALPLDRFALVIDRELARAEALIESGTPLEHVYAAAMRDAGEVIGTPPRPVAKPEGRVAVERRPDDPTWGAPDAPVTIVEFSDFECPFCVRGAKTIEAVKKAYPEGVRIVFKNLPLSFHQHADLAARAGVAAHNQGKFWAMHDQLFQHWRQLNPAAIDGFAEAIGLNKARFQKDLASAATRSKVDADKAEAARIGVRGTPNFFINGRKIAGAQPFAAFKNAIDDALANP